MQQKNVEGSILYNFSVYRFLYNFSVYRFQSSVLYNFLFIDFKVQ
jgi:hypothetical protein